MERIRSGMLQQSKSLGVDLVAHDLGHGHLELVGYPAIEWQDVAPLTAEAYRAYLDACERHHAETWEERKAKSLRNASKRACTRVRRLCKAMGADTLLTLTYRANVLDLDQAKADLKAFNRILLRHLPGFQFVAGFERQARGCWHMHLATAGLPTFFTVRSADGRSKYRVKSFDLFRSVWRSVTKDRGGNVDVSRRKRHSRSSPARIAAYISKYITKAFAEGDKWTNRWTSYGETRVPSPVALGRYASMLDLLQSAYSLLATNDTVIRTGLSRWNEVFFLAAERVDARIKPPQDPD
ncbi:MAG: hypothetical protein KF740_01435 [Ramlibacter sp.]|nr:hypothetical protein [Ramlibacter sp.]